MTTGESNILWDTLVKVGQAILPFIVFIFGWKLNKWQKRKDEESAEAKATAKEIEKEKKDSFKGLIDSVGAMGLEIKLLRQDVNSQSVFLSSKIEDVKIELADHKKEYRQDIDRLHGRIDGIENHKK